MKGKIIILIYQTYAPYQGRYPRTAGHAKILKGNGFDVTILACDREGSHPANEILEGIRVKRIPVKTGEMLGPFRQVLPLLLFWVKSVKWLLTHQFDILHCHNLDVLPVGCLIRVFRRRPVLFDSHEPNYYALWPDKWKPVLQLVNLLERLMARIVDAVTVTNHYQVQKYKKVGARRVELIGNYPLPHLRVDKLPEEKLSRNHAVFGRLGTIYPESGFEASIAAFARIVELYPQARLLIAGRVVDNYKGDFLRLIEPFRDSVEHMGTYSEGKMPELYRRIDVSLLIYPKSPWFRNITPRKFFDSLANGVPVIMTDIGGLGRLIREHECGLVVDERNIGTIIEPMSRLIDDPSLRRKMALNAFRLASTNFDWQTMARRFVDLQKDLMIRQGQDLYEKR